MSGPELYDVLIRRKVNHEHVEAYADLTRELRVRRWLGSENFREVLLRPGTTVRIVMVSRLGDFGITDHLTDVNGYGARVMPDDDVLTNFRFERISKEDPRAD